MTRAYRMKERAERQDKTRQKIVEAAIALHQTKGPLATSMADIAEKAGVGRVTVYRHFPDEATMVRACSGQYFERNPLPDPESWRAIAGPAERLRHALAEAYAYHRSTETMMTRVLADARDHPMVAPYHAHWRRAAEVLAEGFPDKGRRRIQLTAALALALSFDSWRTLVRDYALTDEEASSVASRLVCDCAEL
jgi:AcrR family transcriptional regulator